MENRVKIRSIWNTARGEYIKWVTDPRMIIIGVLIVFIRSFAVVPMLGRVSEYGEPLNLFEPFVAVGNSPIMTLFMPLVYLLLISDFPVISGNSLFMINRIGRTNWFLGQLLFILMSIFSFIGVILISCILMSKGRFSSEWSDTISKFSAQFPEKSNDFVSQLIRPNLYNQIRIITAVFEIIILLSMYLLVLALILSLMKMLYLRSAGLLADVTLIVMGAVTCGLKVNVMWFFPTANMMVWLHFDELLRKPITPVSDSFIYFAVLIVLLLTANFIIMDNMQFINIEQEGAV